MQKIETKFIVLMAYLMSLTALAIDAIMPALSTIQETLNVQNTNTVQLVISIVFLGMSFGLVLYGPLSDTYGRKKPLYLGLSIFIIGSVISLFAQSIEVMLFGRFLQGFGAASTRVVCGAMIRDCYSGAEMAKVMSLIMMVFIIVPAIAPTLGQVILYIAPWQGIFIFLIIMGISGLAVLKFQQKETLVVEKRREFSVQNLISGFKETLTNRVTRAYTIVAGLVFGAFIGYLSLAQQIFQIQYNLGDKFSYYFGCLALFIGLASFLNSKLVDKYGMTRLTDFSLKALVVISGIFLLVMKFNGGEVPLYFFLLFLAISFLPTGLLFGNLNTLAIEPMGHIAGIASSIISSVQTLISVIIGGVIGQMYVGDLYPLVIGFFATSLLSTIFLKFFR